MPNKFKIILSLFFTILFIFLFSCDETNPVGNNNTGTITDIDGNVYNTIKIGNQEWTVENLRTTKYNNGTSIQHVTDANEWANLSTGAYCYYDNDNSNKEKYGALYNLHAVNTGKLAPNGWHVPDSSDWNELRDYLIANGYNWDGTTDSNKIAKAMATKTDWASSDEEGDIGNDMSTNNSSGFSALPGGERNGWEGGFGDNGESVSWWEATEGNASRACPRLLSYEGSKLRVLNFITAEQGCSVRLLQD